ncbi:DUF1444 family protein [uncultured Clostridium sp.]|uniref:DUF1444 family protein n=1 Tax=uncultured Clostridium sp. TaxID=59620 RepID=UPI002583FFD6|nr:DUF1444 family protein [uncultured Clostridium sp.]MDU1350590.1 DUF1444 family protein [Clostridium argentinense]
MLLDYERFKVKMLNEFIKEYPDSHLENEDLKVIRLNLEATISLDIAFQEYNLAKNFKFICDIFKKAIQEEFTKYKFKVDYNKLYPLIKSKDFGKGEAAEFVREHLFLNLDVLYAVDSGETFRFVLEEDEYNMSKLKQSAMNNLDSVFVGLTKLDKDFDIYSISFLTDYSSSFILLDRMKKQIEKKVGANHLLAIPSSTSLLVARNHPRNMDILKTLINVDPDPHKVSDHIYKCKNGMYEYIEKNDIFRIIK